MTEKDYIDSVIKPEKIG